MATQKAINEVVEILRGYDRFIVVSHVNPDGDAVGSLLGLYLALKEMGKQAWALAKEPLPEIFDFLPGSGDVLVGEVAEEVNPQWIVSLDVASRERISGSIDGFRDGVKVINIDHHPTNPHFGDVNLVEPALSSTAELVFRVLRRLVHTVSPQVGMCLYTGIITDTGCFRYAGVTSETLNLAAEILNTGFDPYVVSRSLFEEYPLSRLFLERVMLERIQVVLDGRVLVSVLYPDDFDRLGAAMSEAENLVNRLRENQGIEVGILFIGLPSGAYRVSFRSKGRVDVSSVAKTLGGGGHRGAAGLRSELPFEELKSRIIELVGRALEDKGSGLVS